MAQLHINRAFAENLGLTLGGSVREQVTSLFNREVPKAAGVKLNPLPFVGGVEKARFRVMWAAALQGASVWAITKNVPEVLEDEKLLRKAVYQMQQIVDTAILDKLFPKLTQEDLDHYNALRRRMNDLGTKSLTTKEDFARAFVADIRGFKPADVPDSLITAMAYHFDMACQLSAKLIDITVKSPNSYHRIPNAQAQNS